MDTKITTLDTKIATDKLQLQIDDISKIFLSSLSELQDDIEKLDKEVSTLEWRCNRYSDKISYKIVSELSSTITDIQKNQNDMVQQLQSLSDMTLSAFVSVKNSLDMLNNCTIQKNQIHIPKIVKWIINNIFKVKWAD